MSHIVLLGDSIFDNARYTLGGPDVISQVRETAPAGWRASLLAVDGATTGDALLQAPRVPPDASHLVLSVGGNDALMNSDILYRPATTTGESLRLLADLAEKFEKDYRRVVKACRVLRLPLAICSIYNGCFPDPDYQRRISVALMIFNDTILRVGIEHGLAIIDLRLIFSAAQDYANPIEPSSIGGAKIARSILAFATGGSAGARVIAS